jgi:hypothetical protein
VISDAAPLDAAPYTAQYELLRSQVIGATGDAAQPNAVGQRGVGLALLLHEGMPGWLKAVATVIRACLPLRTADAAKSPAAEPDRYATVSTWPCGVPNHDLTALLTSLVLSTRCTGRAVPRQEYRSCQ